ncbi:MAG TPA: cation:proton antiporter, partial [Terriglobia bacterium]|nr:cation:proton antiporter [Terriglobia bacterium]
VGEMFGGIVLGPTIFGLVAPAVYFWLFQSSSDVAIVRDASIKLGMLFFLFYAGSEVNLSDLRRLGRRAVLIGLVGTVLPIAAGVGLVYLVPRDFWGPAVQEHFVSFALFIGMNLANSANPVIARILMDLGLLNGPIGTLIMTATIVDDLVNWTLFAIILSDIAPSAASVGSLPVNIFLVACFFVIVLGFGRWLGPRMLHWARGHVTWPSGFIALTALLILIAGSASEALGTHAFLGAFLVGVALGGRNPEQKEAHGVIGHFVMSFFAPIYFTSMGMTTDFIRNFDVVLVLMILVVACLSKIGAVLLGARISGMGLDRETWAIAFGLNARGATGIILAGVGLTNRVIDERIFVAIVVMAIVTSLMSGPIMNRLVGRQRDTRDTRDMKASESFGADV